MLSPGAAKVAADVATQCLKLIMQIDRPPGESTNRNPEQIALIGELIQSAINSTQPKGTFAVLSTMKAVSVKEESNNETSAD